MTFLRALNPYFNKRMLLMLILGFSSGLPLALTGSTLAAWMVDYGVSLQTIGIFALTGLPYALKFLWSPLMDRFTPNRLGRRRGWIVITQLALIVAIVGLGFLNPNTKPWLTAIFSLSIAFFSASQDIALDAYRTEFLLPEERGTGSGVWIMGYRLALLVSGALALILSDHIPWATVFALVASCLFLGMVAVILAPEPEISAKAIQISIDFRTSVVMPFTDLLRRHKAGLILLFIALYKIGDVAAAQMTTPYILQHLGFSRTELGTILKGFGLMATIAGGLLGGILLRYWTLKRALFVFGTLQGISTLGFITLEITGREIWALSVVIGVENLTGGMGTAAYMTLFMTLCNVRFTATQYAFLSSIMALSRYITGAPTGFLVAAVGWSWFFFLCALAAIPSLVILHHYEKWQIEP